MRRLSRLLAAICATTVILAIATLLLVGAAAPAQADVTLYTPFAQSGITSNLGCTALNTGPKAIDLFVELSTSGGSSIADSSCNDLGQGQGCTVTVFGSHLGYCWITYKGSKKAVRGNLTVIDANGNSVLSLDAR